MTDDINPDQAEEDAAPTLDDAIPTRGYAMQPVVGIGGSAGAIPALEKFFDSTPADTGLAFVVIVHLSPDFESQLAELLQRHTAMRVIKVEKTERVEPNTVYVIPPRKALRTFDGVIGLVDLPVERSKLIAVDLFFRALADTHGAHATAVILSGGDGDGAIGIKRIKERGGLTIAQDPEEASVSDMPRAAISTGMVDWVLPVGEMSARIAKYVRLEKDVGVPAEDSPKVPGFSPPRDEVAEAGLRNVLSLLRTHSGRDFTGYKRATIVRRIKRRLQVNGIDHIAGYVECLRTQPGEVGALLQDLLISVTNFFRDPQSFAALEAKIPSLFAGKGKDDSVRVWVAACATGEEVYGIAMLLMEYSDTLDDPPSIQIFGTDLDETAIRTARYGLYPTAIVADVNEQRISRFFEREENGYRVRKELRESVLFATHDVLRDSPFSRLDLVSCRNLLIYLNREAQARVLDTFYFALRTGGILFLGSSESVDESNRAFGMLDQRYRLYEKQHAVGSTIPVYPGPASLSLSLSRTSPPVVVPARFGATFSPAASNDLAPRPASGGTISLAELHLRVIDQVAPPSALVDSNHDVIHLSAAAAPFLRMSGGEPTRNIFRLVDASLRIELRAALSRAAESKLPVTVPPVFVKAGDSEIPVSIEVRPVDLPGAEFFLVIFRNVSRPVDSGDNATSTTEDAEGSPLVISRPERSQDTIASADEVARQLDKEVERMKSSLRETVERYETSTEELKASNEELQAMNEELRSATEELESSREELQSINEELSTVNHELKSKVDELGHSNSDMQNLMDATAIATVFLDRELRITRFTPTAVNLFNLMSADIGRPLSHFRTQLQFPELEEDARNVLVDLTSVEREVSTVDGQWFLARMRPYRTVDDRIAGIVLTFVDITERKLQQEALRESTEKLRLIVENAVEYAIFSLDLDRRITTWNAGAERLLGYSADEALGQSGDIIFTVEDRAAGAPEQEATTALSRGDAVDERFHVTRDGTTFWGSGAMMPMRNADGENVGLVKILRDQSSARANQQALERSRVELLAALEENQQARSAMQMADEAKDRFLAILSHELRNPLASISSASIVLGNAKVNDIDRARAVGIVQRQANVMKVLLDDLLDVSRLSLGRMVLNIDQVALQEVIRSALEASADIVSASRHVVSVHLPDEPVMLSIDGVRMSQVFSNLVINAAKYTPEGGVINIRAERLAGAVEVVVEDNGIGIEPGTEELMFGMFAQSSSAGARGASGLGIGLALARSIVALHQGTIRGESEGLGKGSRFVVRLPLETDESSAVFGDADAALEDATESGDASGPRILLVDDNPDILWSMAGYFGNSNVRTAGGGVEALEVARDFQPDVVVLDLGMPDIDGLEVARRIRKEPWSQHSTLIAATGWGQQKDRKQASDAGFNHHLVKPVNLDELRALIDAHPVSR